MKRMKRVIAILVAFVCMTSAMSLNVHAKESKDYVIKVNLGTNCVTVYKDGKPIKAMICSPSNETPVGTFYTPIKYRWHEMIGNCYAQYCTRITGQVLFHSVWHYVKGDHSSMSVSAYNVMGNKASHGCVRLLCKDAKWIYDNCALKTKVVIFWGDKSDDPLKRPSFMRINTGARTGWDPTDPDPNNPYLKAKPTIEAKSINIEYKSKVTAESAVEIKDSLGNLLDSSNATIEISGKINTSKLGTYKVKYKVKDAAGHTRKKTIKFKVVDTKSPVIKGAKSKSSIAVGELVSIKKGIKAKSVVGKDLTSKVTVKVKSSKGKKVAVKNGNVTFKTAGKYKVTYYVTGSNKKKAKKTVTYTVVDKKVKAAMKATKVEINEGDTFNSLAYISYLKSYNGKALSTKGNVVVNGTVQTNKPGTYNLTYTFTQSGKAYTKVVKSLQVVVKAKEVETTTSVQETTTTSVETTTTPAETTVAP